MATFVATVTVQWLTVAPVFLSVTLWKKPPLQALVVSSVAVTVAELAAPM